MVEVASPAIVLDGNSLELDDLVRVARDPRLEIACDRAALECVGRGHEQIVAIVERYRAALENGAATHGVYGVTTGFGEFKRERIAPDKLERLQRNILLSHAVGVGDNADNDDPANYFPAEIVRATLILRINAFLKGHSGVRPELVDALVRMVNRGIVPLVPTRGSLGSSGDLCPLAHLFVVLLGQGRFYVVKDPAGLHNTFAGRPLREAAKHLAGDLGLAELPTPTFKEGLALSNGATFSAAMLALAVHDAVALASACDAAAALTLESICGRTRALDPKIHAARGLPGQIASAANIRQLVTGSTLVDRAAEVQDAYSVRCAPQVHGASRDAIAFARMVIEREINAATDNPLFFPGAGLPWDRENFAANMPDPEADAEAYSAGNFHGQPLALAADFLAIAVAELANISERRGQLLLDQNHNRQLPANLVSCGGINSGYMIAQYCAASLVSENKVLAHPASVDSIPTSANSEDHNAMATVAARKLRTIVGNAQAVVAIELLVAAQALEWRVGLRPDPNAPAVRLDADDEQQAFSKFTQRANQDPMMTVLGRGTAAVYGAIRARVAALLEDRRFDADISTLRAMLERGELASHLKACGIELTPITALRAE